MAAPGYYRTLIRTGVVGVVAVATWQWHRERAAASTSHLRALLQRPQSLRPRGELASTSATASLANTASLIKSQISADSLPLLVVGPSNTGKVCCAILSRVLDLCSSAHALTHCCCRTDRCHLSGDRRSPSRCVFVRQRSRPITTVCECVGGGYWSNAGDPSHERRGREYVASLEGANFADYCNTKLLGSLDVCPVQSLAASLGYAHLIGGSAYLGSAHMEPRALFSPAHVGCFTAPSKSLARTMELLKQELTNTASSRGAKPVIVIDDLQGLLASPKDRRMWLADWRSRLTHSLTHSRKHQHMSSSFCDRWCTSARTASCAMWYSHRLIPSLEYPLSQVQQGLRTRHCLLNCCSSS